MYTVLVRQLDSVTVVVYFSPRLSAYSIPIPYYTDLCMINRLLTKSESPFNGLLIFTEHRPHGGAPLSGREVPMMPRTESTSEFQPLEDKEVEYFFASDASAVIEHTNRVIYLEVSAE